MEDGSESGRGLEEHGRGWLRGNGVLMRIPSACSVRGLSVGSAVECEEREQPRRDLNAIKAAAQVLQKNCSVSSGLVLIEASLKQRQSRVKLEDNKRN